MAASRNRLRNAVLATIAAMGVSLPFANPTRAAVTYWDPQGTTGANPFIGSMSGTWETNKWSTSSSGSATPVAWIEATAPDFAVHSGIGTPAYTVTMNSDHNIAGAFDGSLTPNSSDVTIQGTGHWKLSGGQGFNLNNASDGSLANVHIKVPLVDGNYVAGATTGQIVAEGNGQLFLDGVNTYSGGNFTIGVGGTLLGYSATNWNGIINFNNNSSFGSGAIVLMRGISGSSGALVAENSGINIPNVLDFSQAVLSGGGVTSNNPTPFLNIVGSSKAGGGTTFSGLVHLGNKAVNLGSGGTGNLVILSNVIDGTGASLTKFNPSDLELSAVNTYTGSTTISAGRLILGKANSIASSSSVVMGGGTLDPDGLNQAMTATTLGLTANSVIDFGSGPGETDFADSHGVAWTASKTLNLANFNPSFDLLFVGTSGSGLTSGQLAEIQINGVSGQAVQLSTGQVVPEPASLSLLGLGATALLARRRRA